MSDQQTNMRERFEVWYRKDISADADFTIGRGYEDWDVCLAHQAWQAALSTAPEDSLPVADEAVAYRCRDPSIIGGGAWHYVGKDEYLIAEGFEVELLFTSPAPLPSVPVEAIKNSLSALITLQGVEPGDGDENDIDAIEQFLSQLGAEQ